MMVAAALCGVARPVCAQQESKATITELEIGIGGTHKVGFWTPVRITLNAGQSSLRGTIALTTPDNDGVPVTFIDDEPVTIDAGQQRTLERYIKLGRRRADINVEVRTSEGVVAQRGWVSGDLSEELASNRKWILTLGPDIGVAQAVKGPLVTGLDNLDALPSQWQGYEGVDIVVLSTSDFERFASISLEQVTALERWVRLGGRLIFCVGSRGEDVLSDESPWRVFAPGSFSRVLTARSLSSLETYVASSQALDAVATPGGRTMLTMTLLEDVRGKVPVFQRATDGIRPVVVRAPTGLGQVVFAAVDLDQPPFSIWEGRRRLVEKLLSGDEQQNERLASRRSAGQLMHLGYDDLVGQLRSALDQFSGVRLVAFSWVAGLILAYILLIGPADYFLLKDVIRRMQWTWVSLPIVALLFSGLAIAMHRRYKTPEVKLNQIDLVDVDAEAGLVRGTTWTHVYSPRTAVYDVRVTSAWLDDADPVGQGCLLSWQGLPGTGLGGLERKSTPLFNTPLFKTPYTVKQQASASSLVATPIQVDGTKTLVSRWWTQADLGPQASLIVNKDGLLRGEVTNPLSVELTECLLLFENWVFRLDRKGGILKPGDSTRLDGEKGRNLSWRLTRRRVVEIKDVTTPWNQRELDVPRLLEMMMFHETAGGENYTGLQHRYQPYIDFSEHLLHDRAILMGHTAQPATELVLDGASAKERYDQHWTFYRVVFPVQRADATESRR